MRFYIVELVNYLQVCREARYVKLNYNKIGKVKPRLGYVMCQI